MKTSFLRDFADIIRGKVPYLENVLAVYNVYKNIKDYETVALGSSHMASYQPKENGLNLCISSQDLYYSYEMYKLLNEENPKLKNIIVSFSLFTPGHCLIKTGESRMTILYKIFFGIDYQYPEIAKEKHFGIIERYYRYKLRKYYEKRKFIEGYRGGMPENYFETTNLNSKKAKAVAIKHYKNNRRECSQMYLLKEFIRDVQKNNQNLYLFMAPNSKEYRENLPSKEELFKEMYEVISDEPNVHVIDFYNAEGFEDEDFFDELHLNIKGAKKISKYINKIIEEGMVNA